METNEKTVYWLCKETVRMKGTDEVAFKEGEKYPQIKPFQNNILTLRDERGHEHTVSENMREDHFEEVK